MDSTKPTIDVQPLRSAVLAAVPSCTAAVLVGSSATRELSLVRDIDVTAFSPDLSIDAEQRVSTVFMERPLDIVLHHPAYFRTICSDDKLLFLNLRELRKLIDGLVFFGPNGQLNSTLAHIGTKPIPIELLRPILSKLRPERHDRCAMRERLSLYC